MASNTSSLDTGHRSVQGLLNTRPELPSSHLQGPRCIGNFNFGQRSPGLQQQLLLPIHSFLSLILKNSIYWFFFMIIRKLVLLAVFSPWACKHTHTYIYTNIYTFLDKFGSHCLYFIPDFIHLILYNGISYIGMSHEEYKKYSPKLFLIATRSLFT